MARRASKRQETFIQDIATMLAHWQAVDPTSFGLDEARVQALVERYEAARDALRKAQKARDVAKARTLTKRQRLAELRREFAGLSEIIDGVAKTTGDKGVYARARIAPPDTRAPLPAPPPPRAFEHALRNDGSIEVRFEIDDEGRGSLVYEVQRQLVPIDRPDDHDPPFEPPYQPLMVVSARRFIDDEVPEGLRLVCYRVRALRSNGGRSDWAQGSAVYFGTQKRSGGRAAQDVQAKPVMRASRQPLTR